MTEPHEPYRQREEYNQNNEQAAPGGWMRKVAYAVLPALASLYFGGCATNSGTEKGKGTSTAREAGEKRGLDKITLRIQNRDGTIEEIVVDRDDVILCTEEDIFGKKQKPQ